MFQPKRIRFFAAYLAFWLLVVLFLNALPSPAQAEFSATASDGTIAGRMIEGSAPLSLTSGQIGQSSKDLENWVNPLSSPAELFQNNPAVEAVSQNEKSGQSDPVRPRDLATFPSLGYSFPANPVTEADKASLASQKVPPDTMGAIGPTQFLMAINGLVRVLNKTTGVPETPFGPTDPSLETFFSSIMTAGSGVTNSAATPRVRYDRLSSRWFVLAADNPIKAGVRQSNRIMLAVSDGPNITSGTVWHFFYFQPNTVLSGFSNTYSVNPTLGVDTNALYIGVNLFTTTPQVFTNTAAFVVRKSSVLANGEPFVTGFAPLIISDGPYAPQGVDNLDSSVNEGYFIGVGVTTGGPATHLILRKITNPGTTPTISANLRLNVPDIAQPVAVPHKGGGASPGNLLNPVDYQLSNAVIQKGSLWTSQSLGLNPSGTSTSDTTRDRDGIRWYEIALAAAPTLRQSGIVYDNSPTITPRFYWLPSLIVSGQGHTAIGFNVAGANDYISAAFTGRVGSDAMGTTRLPVFYQTSTVAYTPANNPSNTLNGRLWGRYSYTSLDPEDNMTFWTIQEFASNTDYDNDHVMDGYGIQVARINAPPPATIAAATPPFIIADQSDVDITISGNPVDGAGFYDPGPAFSKHMTASVGGGVTVNSVTYLNPTAVRLNLSAVGVTPGQYDVSITNPDGQTVTAPNLLKVTCYQTVADNAVDGTAGSLRDAVNKVNNDGACATLNLKNVTQPIILTSPLSLPPGIIVSTAKPCSTGQVEIKSDGSDEVKLTLNGDYFFGIYVHGFKLPLLAQGGTGANNLNCVKLGAS